MASWGGGNGARKAAGYRFWRTLQLFTITPNFLKHWLARNKIKTSKNINFTSHIRAILTRKQPFYEHTSESSNNGRKLRTLKENVKNSSTEIKSYGICLFPILFRGYRGWFSVKKIKRKIYERLTATTYYKLVDCETRTRI